MFFSFIRECFTWLPTSLFIVVNTTITIFLIISAVQVIKLIIDLVDFLAKVLGGIFAKVVQLFL